MKPYIVLNEIGQAIGWTESTKRPSACKLIRANPKHLQAIGLPAMQAINIRFVHPSRFFPKWRQWFPEFIKTKEKIEVSQ